MKPEEMEVNKVYTLNHARKGRMKLVFERLSSGGVFIDGKTTDEEQEPISLRAEFCTDIKEV